MARRRARAQTPKGEIRDIKKLTGDGLTTPCCKRTMRLLSVRGRIARPYSYPRNLLHTQRPGSLQFKVTYPILSWRGAKTKSAARLSDLAQGPLESKKPLAPFTDDVPQYPAVVQGAKYNMQKFANCVLLTRVGNFYEVGPS
ncbi:hypothetical protein H106_06498 [Trichophyton rubrum CBS 735.88]|uniref:Uncharacterized protein n=1 Tax=Trichophyton rubrum (strain ATCC MYA-4607 / CBS 118892) TaxID=559305 RepID=A0A080WEW9_TRIRC|nr:uncharacterized protein TERG_11788 [Trichophyton rubrum CBS 118892]EZG02968.1 hypothetical protein H106_06498 [Trichophyton rubrum CBS 735.88]KFL60741.1 hypothetical protein TERG_11788 [Trichophyton rubrum CBS 118892]